MIRAVALVAFAIAVASAQRWPMITINAAGDIVLQSLTRATSFQLTPVAITTGPTTGTAGVTTATAATAGVSAYTVTVSSSGVTGHGVALPTPTVGAKVVFFQASTLAAYTIWTSSTSHFINSESTGNSFAALSTSRRVECNGVSTIRWNCVNDNQFIGTLTDVTPAVTYVAAASTAVTGQTLVGSPSGTVYVFYGGVQTAATTLALAIPACTSSNTGATYTVVVSSPTGNALATTATITSSGGNIIGATTAAAIGTTTTITATSGAAAGAAAAASKTFVCAGAVPVWIAYSS